MSLLSMDNIIRELEYSQEMAYDFDDFLARADSILESNLLEEVEYNKISNNEIKRRIVTDYEGKIDYWN